MKKSITHHFPASRVATMDICRLGRRRHYVTALLEVDVTHSRQRIRAYRRSKQLQLSLLGWLVSLIARTVKDHPGVAAHLRSKRKSVSFTEVNVSVMVEKEVNGVRVPLPLLIENAAETEAEKLTALIGDAKGKAADAGNLTLHKKSSAAERIYPYLPRFLRMLSWKIMLRMPHFAHRKMGDVSVTSVPMTGEASGWFIPISVHPLSFGIGGITKKITEQQGRAEVREMLSLTVLLDHDVADGVPMASFLSDLTQRIRRGEGLDEKLADYAQ